MTKAPKTGKGTGTRASRKRVSASKTVVMSQSETQSQPLSSVPEADRMVRLFGLRTIFSRPVYLPESDWLEHIPFAFWLVEALAPRLLVDIGAPCGAS